MDVTCTTAHASTADSAHFKTDLLTTLSSLPVPNKTMLLDSKLLPLIEKWITASSDSSTTVVKKEACSEKNQNSVQTSEALTLTDNVAAEAEPLVVSAVNNCADTVSNKGRGFATRF